MYTKFQAPRIILVVDIPVQKKVENKVLGIYDRITFLWILRKILNFFLDRHTFLLLLAT